MIPSAIQSEDELELSLSEPTPAVVETLGRLPGDLLLPLVIVRQEFV